MDRAYHCVLSSETPIVQRLGKAIPGPISTGLLREMSIAACLAVGRDVLLLLYCVFIMLQVLHVIFEK